MKEAVPLMARMRATRKEPVVLSGYPRMGSQLSKVEGAVGRVALAVQAC